ncbi:MAG: hypothetical protein H0W08_20295 [Acidobacteria bacterium]|nr:hypothetical protein [Acidobacteriota bacterium]
MTRSTTKWTLACTAAALITLPAVGAAQTQATPQPPTAQPPATSQQQPTPTAGSTVAAREHLAKATAALAEIKTATLSVRAKTQVAEVKRRLNTLERTVATNEKPSAAGAANRSPAATTGSRAANWGTEVAAIDKALTTLLGPDSGTSSGAATPTGTGGSKPAATVALDDATRASLTQVRTHLTAFATAMAGGQPQASSTPPTAEPTGATPTTSTSPTQPDPMAPQTSSASSAAGVPASGTPATSTSPAAQSTATAQPDEPAARRHLTEARNTLSAMTQLPAASQLTGEARTQVSQLISNFNELITAQSEWRGSYTKVSANLASLLGPETTGATTDPAATAGAVGTSGSAASTMDPTLRDKLVELRRNLSDFEKAAGGGAASASTSPSATTTEPSAPAPAPAASSTPPAAGSMTAPGATPPAATSSTTASPQTSAAQGATQPTTGNADIMRHVAAIEALFKLEDEGGGLTLTKAQVEQLRSHWAALKGSIEKK